MKTNGKDGKDRTNGRLSLALQNRLSAAKHEHQGSLDALREAVCDYVDDLRAVGLGKEQALENVRSFVTSAQGVGDGAGIDVQLVGLIGEWCIDRWDAGRPT